MLFGHLILVNNRREILAVDLDDNLALEVVEDVVVEIACIYYVVDPCYVITQCSVLL